MRIFKFSKPSLLVILAFLTLSSEFCLAQFESRHFDINWGEEWKEEDIYVSTEVLATNEKDYLLRLRYRNLLGPTHSEVVKYDQHLQKVANSELRHPNDGSKCKNRSQFIFNQKLYVLQTCSGSGSYKLFAQEINQSSFQLVGNRSELMDAGVPQSGKAKTVVGTKISPNKKHLLVYSARDHSDKHVTNIELAVFDQNMQKVWGAKVPLKTPGYDGNLHEIKILDDGAVSILRKSEAREKSVRKSKGFRFDLIVVKNHGKEQKIFAFDSKGKFLSDAKIVLDESLIYVVGWYSYDYYATLDGMFFSKVNVESGKQTLNQEDFLPDAFAEDLEAKKPKKVKKTTQDRQMSVHLNNGSLYLVTEVVDQGVSLSSASGGNKSLPRLLYGNISVVKLSAEGKITWTKRIFKDHGTQGDFGFYSSYVLAFRNDKLYFIYNDDRRNVDMPNSRKVYQYDINDIFNGIVILAIIDSQGKLTKEILSQTKHRDFALAPRLCKQLDDEIILFSQRKSKYRFGKAVFKDASTSFSKNN